LFRHVDRSLMGGNSSQTHSLRRLDGSTKHGSYPFFSQIKEPDQHFSQIRNRALTHLQSCDGAISSTQHLIYAIRIAVWANIFHNFHFQWR
jgi:hypothetical protein